MKMYPGHMSVKYPPYFVDDMRCYTVLTAASNGSFMPPPAHRVHFLENHIKNMLSPDNSRMRQNYDSDVSQCDSGFSSRSSTPNSVKEEGEETKSLTNTESKDISQKGLKRNRDLLSTQDDSTKNCPEEGAKKNSNSNCNSVVQSHGSSHQAKRRNANHYSYHQYPTYRYQYQPVGRLYLNPAGYRQHAGASPRWRDYHHQNRISYSQLRNYLLSKPPVELEQGSEWDSLSKQIWAKFEQTQQKTDTFKKKIRLRDELYDIINDNYFCELSIVGSSVSGFGSDTSDVDMCLMYSNEDFNSRNWALETLCEVQRIIRCRSNGNIQKLDLIRAKVPILKFYDTKSGIEVDLNYNNTVGVRNTHLLFCYSQLDWRVRPLVLLVKLWASQHNINDARFMTISSYSLVLMVIHYLQSGVNPAVLPNLQNMYPSKFFPNSNVFNICIQEKLQPYNSQNSQSLGELLVGFLDYYNQFDYDQYAISIRNGKKIPVARCREANSWKNDPHQWKLLCIEEPFDRTNTARSVYDEDVFNHIKDVIRDSWVKLKSSKDLQSILND